MYAPHKEKETVGSYRLIQPLGISRCTYRAVHRDTGEICVVKVFRGKEASPEVWGEIGRVLRRVREPKEAVCSLVEVGLLNGEVYAVAPYLDGQNLSRIVKVVSLNRELTRDPLHHQVSAFIMSQIAHGLVARGGEHLPHPVFSSDMVSPDELFVLAEGTAKVLDPAWAWLRTVLVGSPWGSIEHNISYMLPDGERPAGARDAGRTWALGVLLWELLVGYRLFRRYTMEATLQAMLQAIREQRVLDPRALNPTVPDGLAELSLELLTKPGSRSLEDIAVTLGRHCTLPADEAPIVTASWLKRITALRRDSGYERIAAPRRLDAVLEESPALWPESDASTTCVISPPSQRPEETLELSWLENDPLPRVKVVVPKERPSRWRSVLRVAGIVGVLAVGTILSVLIVPSRVSEPRDRPGPGGDSWQQTDSSVLASMQGPLGSPRAPSTRAVESIAPPQPEAFDAPLPPDDGIPVFTLAELDSVDDDPIGAEGHVGAAVPTPPQSSAFRGSASARSLSSRAPSEGPEASDPYLAEGRTSAEAPSSAGAPFAVEAPYGADRSAPSTPRPSSAAPYSRALVSNTYPEPVRHEPAETVAPLPLTGDLFIRASENTKVMLEGRVLGTGVFTVRLPAGKHLLSFHAPGQPPAYVLTHVNAGSLGIVGEEANPTR